MFQMFFLLSFILQYVENDFTLNKSLAKNFFIQIWETQICQNWEDGISQFNSESIEPIDSIWDPQSPMVSMYFS